jgi:glucose-1-phosphate thymidylyltransferase
MFLLFAILLCAGFATRLYPLTRDFPKHLLPVAGKPGIDYIVEQIVDFRDLKGIHVVTNDNFFNDFEDWKTKWSGKIDITIHNDGIASNDNRLGPSGDLQFVLKRIQRPSRVMVAAADNIFRFRLEPLWERFRTSNKHYIIGLSESNKEVLRKTGVPIIGENDRVLRLFEKPEHPISPWAVPQLYFFQPSVWQRMDEFHRKGLRRGEKEHFLDYLCQIEKLYIFKISGSRFDIGTISSYHEADFCLQREPVFEE